MTHALYTEEKLPKGWSRNIAGHSESGHPRGTGSSALWRSYTYLSWYNMIHRCHVTSHPHNPKHYSDVYVCKRWVEGDGTKHGFLCFLEDMGERPEGMTIDRIDPAGHYTLDNCGWATSREQARNKRKNRQRRAA